jgi:hypothetical protein
MKETNLDLISLLKPIIVELASESERPQLEAQFNKHINELETARLNAKREGADRQAVEQYNRYQEAMAKGIPQLAKGIIGAVNAYKSGDPFASVAATLEIGATMATTIGAVISKAAGVTGGLVGSILSVFALVLNLFSKQKPTITIGEQLEKVLREYGAEDQFSKLLSIRRDMETMLVRYVPNTHGHHTAEEMRSTLGADSKKQRIEDAIEWLEKPKNQTLDQWGAVLAAQCYAYVYFWHALTRSMEKLVTHDEVIDMTAYLSSCHEVQLNFLKEIKSVARDKGRLWAIKDDYADKNSEINWGTMGELYTHVDPFSKTEWTLLPSPGYSQQVVTVTTRKTGFAHNSVNTPEVVFTSEHPIDYSPRDDWDTDPATYLAHPFRRELKVNQPNENPPKHQITARYGRPTVGNNTQRQRLSFDPSSGRTLRDCYDLWATPGYDSGEIDLYMATGDTVYYLKQGSAGHSPNEEDNILKYAGQINAAPGYKIGRVRAVVPKPFKEEDQRILGLREEMPDLMVQAIYCACEVAAGKSKLARATHNTAEDHLEIQVVYRCRPQADPDNQLVGGYLEAPWPTFRGIAVDKRFLWVFQAGSIACVTHTEVQVALRQKKARPPWMVYFIPPDVNVGKPYSVTVKPPAPCYPNGLIDLAACDDGTLTALYTLTMWSDFARRNGAIYALTPQVDRQKRTLTMAIKESDNPSPRGWDTVQSLGANQVIKQPIFCWSLLEGMEAALEETLASS